MGPKEFDLEKLALYDPVAAYGIFLGIPLVPFVMSLRGTFSSFGVALNTITADLDTTIGQRTWIDNASFEVQAPNVFAGNIQKPMWDAALQEVPGIDMTLTVFSGPKYPIGPNFFPLRNLAQVFKTRWPKGWVIEKQQSLQAQFMLTQAPGGVDGDPPYTVCVTFIGWNFVDPTMDNISGTEAADALRKGGICVPTGPCAASKLR